MTCRGSSYTQRFRFNRRRKRGTRREEKASGVASLVDNITMEPKRTDSVCKRVLLTGFTLCVILVTKPTSAIEIYADPEVMVQNGTTGVLRCTFKSSEVVSSSLSVTWNFQSSQPDNKFSKAPYVILYFSQGTAYMGSNEFKDRVQFVGDVNKRDVSIQLSPAQFSDNGTYFCDVKNPPDVMGTPARTELRVVLKESLPKINTALIIGIVCGVLVLLIIIAGAACIAMRMLHNRHNYEGCTSLENLSSQAPQPRKKVESGLEGSKSTIPLGPLQGPVIYAQLDHSGSKNSFHKMEPVVYADIRKN